MQINSKKFGLMVITGGSSGIGYDLIRSISNVRQSPWVCNLSRKKPEEFPQDDKVIHTPCDLSSPLDISSAAIFIQNFIAEKNISGPILLINNSGFGSYGKFEELDLNKELKMVQVNALAVVHLTGLLIPLLKKHKGTIVNVASTAAFQPTPYLATYGATKAFVLHWGLSLGEELRPLGIDVLSVCPGPTSTNFFKNAGFTKPLLPSGSGQTSQKVADEILKAIDNKNTLLVTGWKNKLTSFFSSKLPRSFAAKVSGIILKRIRYKNK